MISKIGVTQEGTNHSPCRIHSAVESECAPTLREGRTLRDKRVARRRPQSLPHPVEESGAQDMPPRAGKPDRRFRQRRKAIPEQSDRFALAGPIRKPTGIEL